MRRGSEGEGPHSRPITERRYNRSILLSVVVVNRLPRLAYRLSLIVGEYVGEHGTSGVRCCLRIQASPGDEGG